MVPVFLNKFVNINSWVWGSGGGGTFVCHRQGPFCLANGIQMWCHRRMKDGMGGGGTGVWKRQIDRFSGWRIMSIVSFCIYHASTLLPWNGTVMQSTLAFIFLVRWPIEMDGMEIDLVPVYVLLLSKFKSHRWKDLWIPKRIMWVPSRTPTKNQTLSIHGSHHHHH